MVRAAVARHARGGAQAGKAFDAETAAMVFNHERDLAGGGAGGALTLKEVEEALNAALAPMHLRIGRCAALRPPRADVPIARDGVRACGAPPPSSPCACARAGGCATLTGRSTPCL